MVGSGPAGRVPIALGGYGVDREYSTGALGVIRPKSSCDCALVQYNVGGPDGNCSYRARVDEGGGGGGNQ